MGISLTKQTDIEEAKIIQTKLQDWLTLRDTTVLEINQVADELDNLHQKTKYSKLAGSFAGVVGGGMALWGIGMSLFTAGSSLALTASGFALATGGGVTVTMAGFYEWLRQKTRLRNAQQALDKDKEMLKLIFEQMERSVECSALDNQQKTQFLSSLQSFVGGLARVWSTSMAVYGRAKNGVPKLIETASRTSNSVVKFGEGISNKLSSVTGGMAGIAFVAFDLTQLVKHSVEVLKGSPSDAAQSLRHLVQNLVNEKVEVMNNYINHMNKQMLSEPS